MPSLTDIVLFLLGLSPFIYSQRNRIAAFLADRGSMVFAFTAMISMFVFLYNLPGGVAMAMPEYIGLGGTSTIIESKMSQTYELSPIAVSALTILGTSFIMLLISDRLQARREKEGLGNNTQLTDFIE